MKLELEAPCTDGLIGVTAFECITAVTSSSAVAISAPSKKSSSAIPCAIRGGGFLQAHLHFKVKMLWVKERDDHEVGTCVSNNSRLAYLDEVVRPGWQMHIGEHKHGLPPFLLISKRLHLPLLESAA